MRHADFDKKHGLKTYVVAYGEKRARSRSRRLNFAASVLLVVFGIFSGSYVIFSGAAIATIAIAASTEAVYSSSKSTHLTFVSIETAAWVILLLSAILWRYFLHV